MKALLLPIFLFLYGWNINAQNQPISIGEHVTLKSQILGADRSLVIYTPENYTSTNDKYPVLYLLDAEWHFHYVSGLVKQLANSGDILPLIIVGIVNTNRNRDLTPAGKNDNLSKWGGAKPFLNFIKDEVQPFVKKEYRTQPYSILAGHSFGGLFTVYSMMETPDLFQSYIALSPSLGRNNEQQLQIANSFFESNKTLPQNFYLAVGNEGGFTYLSSKKLMSIIDDKATNKFRYQFQHFENEDHVSMTIVGFLTGLKFIFEGVNPEKIKALDDIFLIEKHFQQLSQRFGYSIQIPEYYYQKFVAEQIGQRELNYALFILKKYEKQYPNAPQMLQGYADAHLLLGNFSTAKEYCQKLKVLDPENEQLAKILRLIE